MASKIESKSPFASQGEIESEPNIEIEHIDDEEDAAAPPERETWGSKLDYLLTLVGYAVGFGNIWRFPYQVRENGGLVFMIPYVIMVALVGMPLFFLELAVGQRRRKGIVYAWAEISPRLGGIGIACGVLCYLVGLYYNTFLAYSISYIVESFRDPLPWTSCPVIRNYSGIQEDETLCHEQVGDRSTKYYWFRRTLDMSKDFETPGNYSWYLFLYLTISWAAVYAILIKGLKTVSYVVYFTALFPYVVLLAFFIGNLVLDAEKSYRGAYRLVKPDWSLLYQPITWLKAGSQIFYSLGLAEGCLAVFASYNPVRNNCYKDAILISIINCSTSVFAGLVVFPMIGLLGHKKYEECMEQMSSLLPGSRLKILTEDFFDVYFFPNVTTWDEAYRNDKSILIRYGYGEMSQEDKGNYIFGQHFNDQDTDLIKIDLIGGNKIKSGLNGAGAVIDMLRDCSIGQEATASGGGTGFVFIGFTEAVLGMKGSNFWAVIFFLMLITLGIDSGFATVEGFVNMVEDLTHWKRWISTTFACATLYVLAILLFPFGWGAYVLDLLDQWTANWSLLMIAVLECIAVAWDYGLAKISYDIRLMTGQKPNVFILLCWKYISPIIILLLLCGTVGQYMYSAATDQKQFYYTAFNPKHNENVVGDVFLRMPGHILGLGFSLMIFCIMWIPIHMCLRKTKYNMLREEAPADFPEDELRAERNIDVEKEEDQFSMVEKQIMGKSSLQNLQDHRDKLTSQSQTSIDRRNSSALSITGPKDKKA